MTPQKWVKSVWRDGATFESACFSHRHTICAHLPLHGLLKEDFLKPSAAAEYTPSYILGQWDFLCWDYRRDVHMFLQSPCASMSKANPFIVMA